MQKGRVWRWKQGQATKEEYRNVAWACRNRVRKVKAQLELELMRLLECKQITSTCNTRETKEDVGLLLNVAGDERHGKRLKYSMSCLGLY